MERSPEKGSTCSLWHVAGAQRRRRRSNAAQEGQHAVEGGQHAAQGGQFTASGWGVHHEPMMCPCI